MPIINLRPISLEYYRDKKIHAFWLHEDVRDGFMEAIEAWKSLGANFRVTETFRSIETQARLKRAKPGLACRPGWSLHGHGRAVDFDVSSIGGPAKLIVFYDHMAKWGWHTIFNFPGKPAIFKSRESWHLQKTDPVGMRSAHYIKKWIAESKAKSATDLQYKRIKEL